MDPKTRRKVWEMIQVSLWFLKENKLIPFKFFKDLKKNRVIILTTHAMEEADALSDRIAVLVSGKLSCIGTPLYLKNNFGEGYK